jgi:hypothetical protein
MRRTPRSCRRRGNETLIRLIDWWSANRLGVNEFRVSLPRLLRRNPYTHFRPRGANHESQRDSAAKPRVARNELPWELACAAIYPEGVVTPGRDALTQPLRGRCSSTTPTQGSFVPRNPGLNDPIPLGLNICTKCGGLAHSKTLTRRRDAAEEQGVPSGLRLQWPGMPWISDCRHCCKARLGIQDSSRSKK